MSSLTDFEKFQTFQKYKRKQKDNEYSNEKRDNEVYDKKSSQQLENQDFPELKAATGAKTFVQRKRSQTKPFKTWLSVVSPTGNASFAEEIFPKLPDRKVSSGINYECKIGDSEEIAISKNFIKIKESATTDENKLEEAEQVNDTKSILSKTSCNHPLKNVKKKRKGNPICVNVNEFLKGQNNKRRRQPKLFKNRKNERSKIFGNPLDSSNPKPNKGKHREFKKKKLSNLKLSILKERIIKQKLRERELAGYFEKEFCDLFQEIDFKMEIKKYLVELNKKKEMEKLNNTLKSTNSNNATKKDNSKLNTDDSVLVDKENGSACKVFLSENEVKKKNPEKELKEIRFSSKLREYCDNLITSNLNSAVSEFIKAIVNLQDQFFQRDPVKAKARKRHVSGLKEVKQHLILKKVKIIFIAPNLEKLKMEGSIYDIINELKLLATSQNVPYAFALNRFKLGKLTRKNVPVSAFAVLNYEGVEHLFQNVIKELQEAKDQFAELIKSNMDPCTKQEENSDITSSIIASFLKTFRDELKISKNEEKSDE